MSLYTIVLSLGRHGYAFIGTQSRSPDRAIWPIRSVLITPTELDDERNVATSATVLPLDDSLQFTRWLFAGYFVMGSDSLVAWSHGSHFYGHVEHDMLRDLCAGMQGHRF